MGEGGVSMKTNYSLLVRLAKRICLCMILLLMGAVLISCDSSADEPTVSAEQYVNVYIPEREILVTVTYDAELGKLNELQTTLENAVDLSGLASVGGEFLGLFDMSEGGNIIYNTEGIIHSDHLFTNGVTLYARYDTDKPAQKLVKRLVFNEWERNSVNSGVFTSITVTEGERVYRFSPQTFTPGGDFAGWEEAGSGRLVTDRDGYLLDDYDIWESEETEFYPRVVPGTVNRCYLHIDGETLTFEYSSNLNATEILPKDERDGRGIIGWSSDPKAKYPSDIAYPTYLGRDKVFFSVKENEHYYAIYSEYKEVTYVYGDDEETERLYKFYLEGNIWGDQLLWEVVEQKSVFLPRYYYSNGNHAVIAYKTERGECLPVGSVSYEVAEGRYYAIMKQNVYTATLEFSDGDTLTEYCYSIANAVITLPEVSGNGDREFLGWYLNSDGSGGRVLYLRTDEYGNVYITVDGESEEIRLYTNTFYAIYAEGGDGQ